TLPLSAYSVRYSGSMVLNISPTASTCVLSILSPPAGPRQRNLSRLASLEFQVIGRPLTNGRGKYRAQGVRLSQMSLCNSSPGFSAIASLAQVHPKFLDPRAWVDAVHDSHEETQPRRHVLAIPA